MSGVQSFASVPNSDSWLYPNSRQSTSAFWPPKLKPLLMIPQYRKQNFTHEIPSNNSIYVKVGEIKNWLKENNTCDKESKNNIYMKIPEKLTFRNIVLDGPQFSEKTEYLNPAFYEIRNRTVNIYPTCRGLVRQLRFQRSVKKLPPIKEERKILGRGFYLQETETSAVEEEKK